MRASQFGITPSVHERASSMGARGRVRAPVLLRVRVRVRAGVRAGVRVT